MIHCSFENAFWILKNGQWNLGRKRQGKTIQAVAAMPGQTDGGLDNLVEEKWPDLSELLRLD